MTLQFLSLHMKLISCKKVQLMLRIDQKTIISRAYSIYRPTRWSILNKLIGFFFFSIIIITIIITDRREEMDDLVRKALKE